MARLTILEFPHPALRARAAAVDQVDASVWTLLDDLHRTMVEAGGIGLAAPQVNVGLRVAVVDVSEAKDQPFELVNARVVASSMPGMSEESCLSVPGVVDVVPRDLKVRVETLDRDGRSREVEAEGLLAVAIQHELDHLDGRLFVDHLPWFKRVVVPRRVRRARAHA